MSRWQPMASMVMTAPSIASMSRSAGMAMISLDLSATLTWPSTRRWRAAKADTIWIAAFPPFLWEEPRNVLPSMAITSADTLISLATAQGLVASIADRIISPRLLEKAARSPRKRLFKRCRDVLLKEIAIPLHVAEAVDQGIHILALPCG